MIKKIIDYIDSLWITEQIWYQMNWKGKESRNVSQFLKEQAEHFLVNHIVDDQGWKKAANDDARMLMILKWVVKNIEYRKDIYQYKTTEYWANVTETLTARKGDCEDGAVLIYTLARLSGVPKSRIKLWAGNTKYGGHACVIYKSEKAPYVWYFMDWCMEPSTKFAPGGNRKAYIIEPDLNVFPGNDPYAEGWFIADEDKGARRYDG